jgi:heavy-metal-associated domain-containing protein
VNTDYAYLHGLDGRLRIKIAAVKGSTQQAQEIEQHFQACEGIMEVSANPVTGNVLILYDSQRITQETILDLLHRQGYLLQDSSTRTGAKYINVAQQRFNQELAQTLRANLDLALHRFSRELGQILVRSTMEVALHRLVYALI